jgi:biopolymer transport protein ExbD
MPAKKEGAMSKFRKFERREVPALNTASLPDLIFSILFFFMIVTNMRSVPVMTQWEAPTATELQKLEEKSLIVYIMIGKPQGNSDKYDAVLIQLNSDFVPLHQIPEQLQTLKKKVPVEEQEKMVTVMKVDKNTPMGLVNDIKQNLREAGILTIHYSAEKSIK